MTIEVRIDRGIEIRTIRVDRHDPRNSRIINPVRPAAIAPSRSTPAIEEVTSFDWSNNSLMLRPGGAAARAILRTLWTPLTTATVEALPFLSTLSNTERRPLLRTMFCCTAQPSCTWPTSLRNTVWPLIYLIGILLRSVMLTGIALVRTVYCGAPILARPDGKVRF